MATLPCPSSHRPWRGREAAHLVVSAAKLVAKYETAAHPVGGEAKRVAVRSIEALRELHDFERCKGPLAALACVASVENVWTEEIALQMAALLSHALSSKAFPELGKAMLLHIAHAIPAQEFLQSCWATGVHRMVAAGAGTGANDQTQSVALRFTVRIVRWFATTAAKTQAAIDRELLVTVISLCVLRDSGPLAAALLPCVATVGPSELRFGEKWLPGLRSKNPTVQRLTMLLLEGALRKANRKSRPQVARKRPRLAQKAKEPLVAVICRMGFLPDVTWLALHHDHETRRAASSALCAIVSCSSDSLLPFVEQGGLPCLLFACIHHVDRDREPPLQSFLMFINHFRRSTSIWNSMHSIAKVAGNRMLTGNVMETMLFVIGFLPTDPEIVSRACAMLATCCLNRLGGSNSDILRALQAIIDFRHVVRIPSEEETAVHGKAWSFGPDVVVKILDSDSGLVVRMSCPPLHIIARCSEEFARTLRNEGTILEGHEYTTWEEIMAHISVGDSSLPVTLQSSSLQRLLGLHQAATAYNISSLESHYEVAAASKLQTLSDVTILIRHAEATGNLRLFGHVIEVMVSERLSSAMSTSTAADHKAVENSIARMVWFLQQRR